MAQWFGCHGEARDPSFPISAVAFQSAAPWVSHHGLRVNVLGTLPALDPTVGPNGRAFIDQLRLVAKYPEMPSHITIQAFLKNSLPLLPCAQGLGAEAAE